MEMRAGAESKNRLDLTNLIGTWINVNEQADFITGFSLEHDETGLRLKVLSVFANKSLPLLALDVHPVAGPGSELAAGFYHALGAGFILAANEKNGVLVLQSYRQKEGLLTREFYYRQQSNMFGQTPSLPQYPAEQQGVAGQGQESRGTEDFQSLIGCWHNTYRQTSWLKAFSIEKTVSGWTLEVFGDCHGITWPPMPLVPYCFDSQETGFVARCDLDRARGLFCAYSNKGLIVVTLFFIEKDPASGQEKTGIFCREFYARQDRDNLVMH